MLLKYSYFQKLLSAYTLFKTCKSWCLNYWIPNESIHILCAGPSFIKNQNSEAAQGVFQQLRLQLGILPAPTNHAARVSLMKSNNKI